ncbi:hypothetical protein CYJ42_05925 [Corynebacterium amycolatum]|nr:hypothetical protein CYJ42_05925 [Corynebacterium amycolatum]
MWVIAFGELFFGDLWCVVWGYGGMRTHFSLLNPGRGSSEGLWIKRGQGLELEARVRGQPLIDELFTYGSAGAHR